MELGSGSRWERVVGWECQGLLQVCMLPGCGTFDRGVAVVARKSGLRWEYSWAGQTSPSGSEDDKQIQAWTTHPNHIEVRGAEVMDEAKTPNNPHVAWQPTLRLLWERRFTMEMPDGQERRRHLLINASIMVRRYAVVRRPAAPWTRHATPPSHAWRETDLGLWPDASTASAEAASDALARALTLPLDPEQKLFGLRSNRRAQLQSFHTTANITPKCKAHAQLTLFRGCQVLSEWRLLPARPLDGATAIRYAESRDDAPGRTILMRHCSAIARTFGAHRVLDILQH
jgi:hypothetical protein